MAKRPVNLNLLTLRFPITAVASVLHRLSGFILFLLIPLLLGLCAVSLKSSEGFLLIQRCLRQPFSQLIVLAMLFVLVYHLLAGIRHLLMDLGLGESLIQARWSAASVMVMAVLCTILLGIFLW